jgi:hypothetical protein
MKKFLVLVAGLMMLAGFAGFAISQGTTVTGKVTAVQGDVVTIEVDKGKGKPIKVGDTVEMTVTGKEQKKAPKAGSDALQGC